MNGPVNDIRQWVIKGDHDLGTAKITYLHIPEYLDTVTFHCQQAVEKYLKAYLIFLSVPFKFSHDLIYLLDLITQNDVDFESCTFQFQKCKGMPLKSAILMKPYIFPEKKLKMH